MDKLKPSEFFAISNDDEEYINWDDRGPMSTGAPDWRDIRNGRQYLTYESALKAAEIAQSFWPTTGLFIVKIALLETEAAPFNSKMCDPEYAEYKRLKEKFES